MPPPRLDSAIGPLDPNPVVRLPSYANTAFSRPCSPGRIQRLVCIDPQMHSAESHAEIHHPGLLRGADFCDSGVEMAPDISIELPDKGWHLFPFGEKTLEPEAEKPTIGRIYRTLTGGDICEELVDVSAHKHFGHSSAVKVRPTIGVPSFTPPHRAEHLHDGHSGISKVREVPVSFYNVGPSKDIIFSFPNIEAPPTISHVPYEHFLRSVHQGHCATSKVQPYSGDDPGDPILRFGLHRADRDDRRGSSRRRLNSSRSASELLHLKRTADWFRDLIKPHEPYKTKLTDLPDKKSARGAAGSHSLDQVTPETESPVFRTLTRRLTTPASIDNKFKQTVSDLEKLISEAIVLATEVAECEENQHTGNFELDEICRHDATYPPPSVHESLPSMDESSSDEIIAPISRGGLAGNVTGQIKLVNNATTSHLPKRYRSAPGMRSRNVAFSIPERTSSLKSSTPDPEHELPVANPKRDRFQEQRRTALHPNRQTKRQASFQALEEYPEQDSGDDSLPPSGCLPNMKFVRKIGSCGSCHIPLISHRRSFQHHKQDELPQAEEPEDGRPAHGNSRISLHGRSHISIRENQRFSLARAYRRQPIARDWSSVRKRFVAAVACLSTASIGMLVGIYAGLVPSIQYWIADLEHYAILGNVFFFVGLAIPTFFFWPLPLLHGRKPYILSSLVIAMPLLFPQAISVSVQRSPYVSTWRWALLSSRAFMGLTLGFASMNFHSILTDLFGASLMSGNPHQEIVDKYDVRRHGGGMGVWLGIWTWCFTGSLGIGFAIGATIINTLNPSWGFYISIVLIAAVLLLNVVCPEVRRSPFRRSVAEVRKGDHVSRRVARGEVMMHRVKDGPTWWGQEVYHGVFLSLEMLRQPGFMVVAVYTGWIYAQVVLIIVLLGSLTSRYYMLKSPMVGLSVAFVSIGALVAVPFQKANIFSRGRHHQQQTSEDTLTTRFAWTSRLLRRAIFCIFLPLVGTAYTAASAGPPVPVEVPVLLAALIGNLSGLAISECNGLIMETFDCSDLQPGMTGRPRGSSNKSPKRTNYSSFPRVTAGFAVCHTLGFLFAALATGIGGMAQRNLGQRVATGGVAGILLVLTVLLLAVLIRFKEVQIIPRSKTLEMEKWTQIRRESIRRRSSGPGLGGNQHGMTEEEMWRPILVGNPSSKMRRVNILELGAMTRWTEIRKKNRLIDERAAHLNRAALESAAEAVEEATGIGAKAADLVRRVSGRRSNRAASPRHFHSGSPGPSSANRGQTIELDVLHGGGQAGPGPGPGPGHTVPDHFKTRGAGQGFSERECVMGQTVLEESEGAEHDRVVLGSEDGDGHAGHLWPPTQTRTGREFQRGYASD
ncbi:hypothetical protein B0T26DRAFT_849158 [Lasiosphaeria miniovina]|uniref:Polyamine transport protein n=1 Tax=Lasiosphaeria miniovina TaxID=1954250 RepID=A0AA40B6L0_9PEZI|nr:uncharacterized protein B0T26DRAFT_849158 [Lasiosphaeria miniovina]KAK0728636.1 hypothetical protein B0T26DRAFT_849158 [Lasiosphaeria miniovina]